MRVDTAKATMARMRIDVAALAIMALMSALPGPLDSMGHNMRIRDNMKLEPKLIDLNQN
jgi:hypothetical protein